VFAAMAAEGFYVVEGISKPMTEIEAPKNVLEDVMRSMRRIHHQPFRFFLNRPQKWFFWISIGSIGGVGVFSLLFFAAPWPQPRWLWWETLMSLSVVMYYLSFMLSILSETVSRFWIVVSPERRLYAPAVTAFGQELSLVIGWLTPMSTSILSMRRTALLY
jgi:hypothetical protein